MKLQGEMENGVNDTPKVVIEPANTNGSSYGKGDRYTAAPNE